MEYAYYSQAAMTAAGERIPMYYPQHIDTNQYISSYYPPHATPIGNAAAIFEELQGQFLSQIPAPKFITPILKSPDSQKSNASSSNLENCLSEDHLAIGMIVFVQPKSDNQENCRCVLPDCQRRKLDAKGYNHPAVVLDIQDNRPYGGELTVLCCIISANPQPNRAEKSSSFTIAQVKNRKEISNGMAPDEATILHLESDGTMHKKSHVIDSHVYAISISQIITFGMPLRTRLTEKSYRSLISNFPSITPPKWIETAKLVASERSALPSPIPTPVQVNVPVQVPVSVNPAVSTQVPGKIEKTIKDLLQFLSKEQVLQAVPGMIEEYPQLIKCFT